MKFFKLELWDVFIIIYLFIILLIILIFPDFLNKLNGIWLIPLYASIVISVHIKHKKDYIATRWSLIAVTAIIVIFKEIADYVK